MVQADALLGCLVGQTSLRTPAQMQQDAAVGQADGWTRFAPVADGAFGANGVAPFEGASFNLGVGVDVFGKASLKRLRSIAG